MRPARAESVIAACAAGLLAVVAVVAAAHAAPSSGAKLSSVVRIEAGWFVMGIDEEEAAFAAALCRRARVPEDRCAPAAFVHEQPAHRVRLRSYRIDRYEVAHADYRRCTLAGVCPPARVSPGDARVGRPQHPVTGVRWRDAQRYCAWVGGRLPSEAQWERAARGDDQRRFPWGWHFHHALANHGLPEHAPGPADDYAYAAPVGALRDGASPYGLLDVAGNVWELTADYYAADAYEHAPSAEPTGPAAGERRVMRGGSWRSAPHTLRVTHRATSSELASEADVGFRCAYDAR